MTLSESDLDLNVFEEFQVLVVFHLEIEVSLLKNMHNITQRGNDAYNRPTNQRCRRNSVELSCTCPEQRIIVTATKDRLSLSLMVNL